jgi:hypothetical protein
MPYRYESYDVLGKMKNDASKLAIRKSRNAIVHGDFVAMTCNRLLKSIDNGLLDPIVFKALKCTLEDTAMC